MYIMVIEYLLFLVYLTRRKAVREAEMKTTDTPRVYADS
jgi:hypothetical protein